MSKKGQLFDADGNQIYRFKTPYGKSMNGGKWCGQPLVIYDPLGDEEYAELIAKGKRGELGQLAGGVGPVLGESKQTAEMLTRSVIAVADEHGTVDTPNREHAVYIAAKFPLAVLDPACDQSILTEIKALKEAKMERADRARQALSGKQAALKAAAAKKQAEVKAKL
jgi:hypothetical protein